MKTQGLEPENKGTSVRILICHVCKSVEEVPDYDGPPEYDQLLEFKILPHKFDSGTPHKGALMKCAEKDWRNNEFRDAVITELEKAHADKEGKNLGLGETLYDLKSNFSQDAMACWKQHKRTDDCGDYQSKSKALYADTKADRKDAGLELSLSARPKHFLCDYCPVQSVIDQKKRAAAKMYDKQAWE